VTPRTHVTAAAVGFGTAALAATRLMLPPVDDVGGGAARFARPTRSLLGLGAIALLALVSEGAMADWSAVYLRSSLGTSAATAALGFALFSLAMAAGRFTGDRLVGRLGDTRVVRRSAAGAALAFGGALLAAHPAAALAGFAAVGFGLANLIPIVFRAASALPGVAASQGIAVVGTFGYVGFLAGPPLIGLAAETFTLPGALALVVLALAWIAWGARHVRAAA
jgi:fucose permease